MDKNSETTMAFQQLLEDAVKETGTRLKQAPAELAAYMSERAAHLSLSAQEPGFDQAVRAERNNVAMRAGLIAHDVASKTDFQFLGIIQGALSIAAKALAAAG